MKFLRSSFTIITEIIILILAILWFIKTSDYEPLIAIIVSGVGLISSIGSKFLIRPKLYLHQQKTDWGRKTLGYTNNNPPTITLGLDNPEQYWELKWNYTLEIRNNSSQNAYFIEIDYLNIPKGTNIKGEFGKIEPLIANEKKEFQVQIIQNFIGNHKQADDYLKVNINQLMEDVKVRVKYKDEMGTTFYTFYHWETDMNKFRLKA